MSYSISNNLPFKHATLLQNDPKFTVEIKPFTPLLVVFEGKPSTGKTTYAQMLSEKLSSMHVNALDSKKYLHESTSFGRFIDLLSESFGEGKNPFTSAAISMTHVLSYACELSIALSNRSDYNVLIMQRMPEDFAFALGTLMRAQNGLNILLGSASSLSRKLVNPDLIVYLRADGKTLSERAASRSDGKDKAHEILMGRDDGLLYQILKDRGSHFLEIDTGKRSMQENIEKISTFVISLLRQGDKP
ncbi:MAG: hypothetical protein ACP5SJ_03555 [Candidatus Micrarchaeia archaeon]